MAEPRFAVVYAGYGQYYLQDLDAYGRWLKGGAATDPDLPPAGWTEQAVQEHRIGVEPHSISVGTARTDFVETVLQFHADSPPTRDDVEHIVEADLTVESESICLYGCTEDPGPQHQIIIPSGRYRIRISYIPIDPPPNEAREIPGDYFRYWMDMWHTSSAEGTVVRRQGPIPCAG